MRRYTPSVTIVFVLLAASVCVRSQQVAVPKAWRLLLPDKQWALQLILPTVELDLGERPLDLPPRSFVIISDRLSKNGSYVLFAMQTRKDAELSPFFVVTLSPVSAAQTAIDLRAFVLKKLVKGAYDVKLSDHNHAPIARYTTDNQPLTYFAGSIPIQKHVGPRSFHTLEAFLVKDDVWARITLTAGSLNRDDEQHFYSLLDSIAFVDVSKPSSSFDYYQLGRLRYMQAQHARAAEAFEAAVQLERRQQTLDIRSWRDLVMATAGLQAGLGRAQTAIETLEYGVTREPANTRFLMQLARTYALVNDKARTLETLRTAFSYLKQEKKVFEETRIPGGGARSMSLPDLNQDPAFKEMMKDKAFRDAVKMIKN